MCCVLLVWCCAALDHPVADERVWLFRGLRQELNVCVSVSCLCVQGDGSPRLLRHRRGHKNPPRRAQYYGGNTVASLADGTSAETCQVLSFGGLDKSLWFVCAFADGGLRTCLPTYLPACLPARRR